MRNERRSKFIRDDELAMIVRMSDVDESHIISSLLSAAIFSSFHCLNSSDLIRSKTESSSNGDSSFSLLQILSISSAD